ncbi:sensor histidine kinase [Geomonas sp. Red875]|uniref:histidine kinase n=1 Tax=Geomesophilobacter sediminis TaxID=2798584 RepID=A0A8J7LUM2_9BACT|nr:sensor histidine kinase [Geomesophilobacter sediminis]
MVTATKPDSGLELRALQAGCADFLAGPLLPELIRLKLQRQLARKNAAVKAAAPATSPGSPRVAAGVSRPTDAAAEVKRLTAELERQKEALAEVAGELQTFSYSISHDLRAPLRHLVGFSNALLEDHRADLQGTALMYLDCIAKAARKMEALVDALLTLSRVGAQDMAPTQIDLSFMVRECVMALQAADPQRPVELRVQENLLAHGDAPLMRTALKQLLENAFKFSGKKDRTVISFGRREGDGGAYFISDHGAGFDMQYASRLFGPFQRLHQEGEFEGVGIGLAVVQRIIRRHGGRVWAEGTPGEGATFYFTLPA